MSKSLAFIVFGILVFFVIAVTGKWLLDKEKAKNRIEIKTPYFKGDFSIPEENYKPLEWLK